MGNSKELGVEWGNREIVVTEVKKVAESQTV